MKPGKFEKAIRNTEDVSDCFYPGLQALGNYSSKIRASGKLLNGSVYIDACTEPLYRNEKRWDFVIGWRDQAYFVEVHPAETGEVKEVLRKLNWLKSWLQRKAPELQKIKANRPYYWIQTNGYDVRSPQKNKAAEQGILPIRILFLQ
jgi:hypothetical protein